MEDEKSLPQSHEVITAAEARETAKKDGLSTHLPEIYHRIREAAGKGLMCISYPGVIGAFANAALTQQGYAVSQGITTTGGPAVRISWEKAE